ncbi:MAG: hypothetical protein E6J77_20120 [Deltaproteobacteria bacterium]|jgi:hypothetical protein|nr:MAG: hypothetical protein E6J77_20120 [Deltaproteobacteria bacterium]
MQAVAVVLASFALAATSAAVAASTCRRCDFGGLCRRGQALVQCLPSEGRCRPNGGILGFNSVPPNTPAYWTLFAPARGKRSLRRLAGRLEVWADYTFPRPIVPGLPAECEAADRVCFGTSAVFRGKVRNDRLKGVARYPDGATCEFRGTVSFGLGGARPNAFVCRTPSGDVLSDGPFQLQLIRLSGCRR